jgi:Caspase domain
MVESLKSNQMSLRSLINTFLFVVALVAFSGYSATAQGLTAKTNQYSLNFKNVEALPASGPLPHIEWILPQLEYTNSTKNKIDIKARVINSSPLKEIRIVISNSVDGSPISTKSIPIKFDQREYSVSQSVTLPDGSNYVSMEAVTEQGVVVSDRRQILVGKDAIENMVALNRKDYALLFATNKYDHWDDLINPINDAQTIAKELKEKYGFEVDLVMDATVEEVWEKLREYNERKFSPQDQLLIFFAGHGHFDESFGEGYVVAKNSLANDVSKTTYLSHNRLRGVIDNIGCNHILLGMDVCFGGTLDPVIASSRGADMAEVSVNQMLSRKWSHRTRKYLTSGGKEYVSDGIADKHSPFAGKLIESLRSYGGDDRILTLTELQGNMEKMKQLPRFGSFGTDEALSDFVFVGKR